MKSILAFIFSFSIFLNVSAAGSVRLYAVGDIYPVSSITNPDCTVSEIKSEPDLTKHKHSGAHTKKGYKIVRWSFNVQFPNSSVFQNGNGDMLEDGHAVIIGDYSFPLEVFYTTLGIDKDYICIAECQAKKYTVALDNQGGVGGLASVGNNAVTYDTAMPKLGSLPTKAGYDFKGYFTGVNGGGKRYYNEKGESANIWKEDVSAPKLYAKWDAKTYTVTLDNDGGEPSSASITVRFDTAIPALETLPVKTGYTFTGYYTGKNRKGTQCFNADGRGNGEWDIAENTTLYAGWEKETYKIILNLNSGVYNNTTGSYEMNYEYGQGKILPVAGEITYSEHEFLGWYDGSGNKVEEIPAGATGDKEFTAKWKSLRYDIFFYSNIEGVEAVKITHLAGTQLELLPVPSNPGYEFTGWNRKADGTGEMIASPVSEDLREGDETSVGLYAQWKGIKYNIALDSNNGSGVTNFISDCIYGTTETRIANTFTHEGYRFAGWAYGEAEYPDSAVVSNLTTQAGATVTLSAIWEYEITFNANGGIDLDNRITVTNQIARYNVETNLIANIFERDGYTFEAWTNATGKALENKKTVKNLPDEIGADTSLYASWKGVTYQITLYSGDTEASFDGQASVNISVTVGNKYDLPVPVHANPERYTFSGEWEYENNGEWLLFEETVVLPPSQGIATLRAKWIKQSDPIAAALGADNLEFETGGYKIDRVVLGDSPADYNQGDEIKISQENQLSHEWIVDETKTMVTASGLEVGVRSCPAVWLRTTLQVKGVLTFKWRIDADVLVSNTYGTQLKFGVETNSTAGAAYLTNCVSIAGNGREGQWLEYSYTNNSDTAVNVYWQSVSFYRTGGSDIPKIGTGYIKDVRWTEGLPDEPSETVTATYKVPYSWLKANLPADVLKELAELKSDAEKAAFLDEKSKQQSPNNKKDINGNPVCYWQDYVMGTNPNEPDDVFRIAALEMDGATPVIKWHPNLNTNGAPRRVYSVFGSDKFIPADSPEWELLEADDDGTVTSSLTAPLMFFKVKVSLP